MTAFAPFTAIGRSMIFGNFSMASAIASSSFYTITPAEGRAAEPCRSWNKVVLNSPKWNI